MTTAEKNQLRRANRVAIQSTLTALRAGGASAASPPITGPTQLLTPAERAALVAAENAKPKPTGCCGHQR